MCSKFRGLVGLPYRSDKEFNKQIDEEMDKMVKSLSEPLGVQRVRRRKGIPLPPPPPPPLPPVPLLPEEGLARLKAARSLQAIPRDRSHVEGDKQLARSILLERKLRGENAYIAPDGPVGSDPYFRTSKITSLNFFNFNDFIKKHEKTVVIFYNSLKNETFFPSREFANAAMRSTNDKHAYAAVNCSVDSELCCKHQISKMPTLKLFSNGFYVSTVAIPDAFTADQINLLVNMTPVLTQPRPELPPRKKLF
ncbi:unnamed protein product [Candidula unifasciata]|uniref:Thioredoxin domain-containing protein n=1 Tax=Candidula unifasciata TaxID=100452 RepID=A0A8S4A1P4_9EUPU|nr:unnamed protein product [Candidula unifasciata]